MASNDPVTTYDAKILAKGYELRGDLITGFHATVPYLLSWDNAFLFARDAVGYCTAIKIGPISLIVPYQLPSVNLPCYAQRFRVEPCGVGGGPAPTGGLSPGEFFSDAIVTIEFETPKSIQQFADDPQGLNQLDPGNPITMCEQSVELGGKMISRKGSQYRYDTSGNAVAGDVGVLEVEAKLVLTFPRVPYLPWQLVQPYIGCVNEVEILGCPMGTLLLEGMGTQIKPSPDMLTGGLAQQVTLTFSSAVQDWNMLPTPAGAYDYVHQAGSTSDRIYPYVDFNEIFTSLQF